MSTLLRLAQVLVAVSLLITLALIVSGDSSSLSDAPIRLVSWALKIVGEAPSNDQASISRSPNTASPFASQPSSGLASGFPQGINQSADMVRATPLTNGAGLERRESFDVQLPLGQSRHSDAIPSHIVRAIQQDQQSLQEADSIIQAAADDLTMAASNGEQEIKDLVVRNKDITVVLEMLSARSHRNILTSPNVKGLITLTLYNTTVEKALEAVLKTRGFIAREEGDVIRVYAQEDLDEMEAKGEKPKIRIYKPRYISATDLKEVLVSHLSDKGKISSTKANQVGIAKNSESAGGDSLSTEDALVVQDTEPILKSIDKIVEALDVQPPQVLIEATLLSVNLDNAHQMGVNLALLGARPDLVVSGNGSTINSSAGFRPSALVTIDGKVQGGFTDNVHGLKFGVINGDLTGFVKLLETVGQTTIVASPKVLALNKQRAEIIIGSQLGYRTVTTTETASIQSVQFLDVGTQLRMRPFVQSDGRVRMELHPEKSSGEVNPETGLPQKSTREVTTNLTVTSGTTIIIGGLIEEQQDRKVQQVPFFGSLPVVGRLFRDETTTKSRSELIVLITPRIMEENEEACEAQRDIHSFEARRDSLEQSFSPYTRLGLAHKFFLKACSYRDQGDIKNARKMADQAHYYDPLNEDIIKLQEELWFLDETEMTHEMTGDSPQVPPLTQVPSSRQRSLNEIRR
jgi:type IV pilus assembly protein PilQ